MTPEVLPTPTKETQSVPRNNRKLQFSFSFFLLRSKHWYEHDTACELSGRYLCNVYVPKVKTLKQHAAGSAALFQHPRKEDNLPHRVP